MKNRIYTQFITAFVFSLLLTFANTETEAQATYCPQSPAVTPGNCASQLGYQSYAKGNYSFASGYQATAYGPSSVAIGEFSYSASQGYAFGQQAKANGSQSLAIGRFVETNASGCMVLGSSISGFPLINNISNSLMVGFNSTKPTLFVGESSSFSGTGKVGIATTNPFYSLHVVGNSAISNGSLLLSATQRTTAGFDWGLGAFSLPKGGGLGFYKEEDDIKMVLTDAGNLGIGTLNPTALLDVNGNVKTSQLEVVQDVLIRRNLNLPGIVAAEGSGVLCIDKFGTVISKPESSLYDNLGNHTATQNISLNGFFLSGDGTNNGIYVAPNGYVGIGVNNPQTALAVSGLICSKEVRVSLHGQPCWPDYVFETAYRLPGLEEVETYVQTHKHLPDIPSAQQVKEEGIELGEMNALLLKKVEELTLYLIEQNKKISELQGEIEALKVKK